MTTDRQYKDKVTVRFIRRDDGGLQAACDAVPGFYLSGRDPAAVFRDVIPALEMLVRHNFGISVEVHPLRRGIYAVVEAPGLADTDRIPDAQDYLLERVAA